MPACQLPARLIMHGKPLDHRRGCIVDPDHLDADAMVPKLDDNPVQRVDGRNVPEVGRIQIDDDALHLFFPEVEGGMKRLRRGEEDLAADAIDPRIAVAVAQRRRVAISARRARWAQSSGVAVLKTTLAGAGVEGISSP